MPVTFFWGKLKVGLGVPTGANLTLRLYRFDGEKMETSGGGPELELSREVPEGQHGWYYLKVICNAGGGDYRLATQFSQEGEAPKPWNSWYWPTLRTAPGPHLYDLEDSSPARPLHKFDQVYGTVSGDPNVSAQAWEYKNHAPPTNHVSWGHCHGYSFATVLHPDLPTEAEKNDPNGNPIAFTADEMQGLWCEVYSNIEDQNNKWELHEENPSVKVFHEEGLWKWLRREQKHIILGYPGAQGSHDYWPLFAYTAYMQAEPGNRYRVFVNCVGVRGVWAPYPINQDETREFTFQYWAVYGTDGKIGDQGSSWVTGQPNWILRPTQVSNFNPHVTAARVQAIEQGN
jgi:hypothetical protein